MALDAIPTTERQNAELGAIDEMAEAQAVAALIDIHIAAASLIRTKTSEIAAAAKLATDALRRGGRLFYCGAGSSGLMGLADALELPGTFGIKRSRIRILLAEGIDTIERFEASAEDSADAARKAIADEAVGANDCLFLLSASGTTPYVVELARAAAEAGAATIGISNNRGSDLSRISRLAIELETSPELVAGSTRMGAATAQKVVLNTISTLVGIRLGHVYKGEMVNLDAANIKLRKRAVRIVSTIADTTETHAAELLDKTGGDVKSAILLRHGAKNKNEADQMLEAAEGKLGGALAAINGNKTSTA